MKTVKGYLSIGLVGGREEEFEFEDDATEEEILEEIKDWAHNYIEYGYTEVDDD